MQLTVGASSFLYAVFWAVFVTSILPSSVAYVPSLHLQARSSKSTALHLLGRFRKKQKLQIPETISVGAPLPDVDVEMLTVTNTEEGGDTAGKVTTIPISIKDVMGTGKSILVGMPGAFTPVCTTEHIPGFIAASSKLQSLGVDTIAIVTTNDKFVNEEWARRVGLIPSDDSARGGGAVPKKTVTILADGDAELVKTLGLVEDMGFGVGVRSKRFALISDNGTVTDVLMDADGMDQCDMTSAANLIRILTPEEEIAEVDEVDQKALALVGGGLLAVAVLAMIVLGGGDHATTAATIALPGTKSAAAVQAGSNAAQFSLLNQFRN
ncbi:Redoxin [Fragilaria crotonensis]|nr:Redoxin [Fragilaria crotonensis]